MEFEDTPYIPRRRSLLEVFSLASQLENDGIAFDDLEEGRTLEYKGENLSYVLQIIGRGMAANNKRECPVVDVKSYSREGELHEAAIGLLDGVSLDGRGKYLGSYMPSENGRFVTLVIDALPSDGNEPSRTIFYEEPLPPTDQ